MKITVVGCGNAFSKKQFNQCYMLEEDGRRLLIDFGAKVPYALDHLNIDIKTINDIYISHLHGDHVGGLEELAFLRYDWVRRPQHYSERHESMKAPCLIGNSQLLSDLWRKSLRGGLESMEGFDATIETYFQPMAIAPNKTFEWMGWECKLIQQVHIMTGSMISHTFGLFMTKEGHKSIYFTTDSQHCSPRQIEIFYKKSDIIFQDCECVGCDVVKKNSDFISGVHANYAQLAAWPSANSVDVGDDILDMRPPAEVKDAIIAKMTAQQNAEKAKAEAEATTTKAKAEATSIRMRAESITPALVEYEKIQVQKIMAGKWNGVQSLVSGGNAWLSLDSDTVQMYQQLGAKHKK